MTRRPSPRTLGTTGLRVTSIGLGLAAIGRPAYITSGRESDLAGDRSVEALRARALELLDAAREAGIGYVDVARSYGRAEEFLASWIRGQAGSDVPSIGSKWGYTYVGEWRTCVDVHEVKDHSLSAFRRQYRETRALLGDHLRLYQVHSATLETGILDDPAVLEALSRQAAEGIAVGITVSGPRQADVIRRALEVRIDGRNPFESVQATWNVLEPSAAPALAEAHDAGWGVIVKEALANGRLTGRDHAPAEITTIAAAHDVGEDAIAIAASLEQPWADVVLSGAVTIGQLRSNLGALDVRLSPSELEALARIRQAPDDYWAERSRRPWS